MNTKVGLHTYPTPPPRGGGVGLSVDSTTFSKKFYNLQENKKSTNLPDFLKKIVDSTII